MASGARPEDVRGVAAAQPSEGSWEEADQLRKPQFLPMLRRVAWDPAHQPRAETARHAPASSAPVTGA